MDTKIKQELRVPSREAILDKVLRGKLSMSQGAQLLGLTKRQLRQSQQLVASSTECVSHSFGDLV